MWENINNTHKLWKTNNPNNGFNVVDLFCGAGAFSEGFKLAGLNIIFANDYDKEIATTYINNHPQTNFLLGTIRIKNKEKLFKKILNRKVDVVIGGPSCQGFSIINNTPFNGDARNELYKEFLEVVDILNPNIFVMENVPPLLKFDNGRITKEIKQFCDSKGYKLKYEIVNASDYEVPQNRKRLFIVGSKKEFYFPSRILQKISVEEALINLPKSYDYNIPNHYNNNYSSELIEDYKSIKEGKTKFKYNCCGVKIPFKKQSRTITSSTFIHPIFNRPLTIREKARIQTFPDNYKFFGSIKSQNIQVGNAVPVKMAYYIALEVKKSLELQS